MSFEGCVFCRIVSGETPAHKVFEDEATLGMLDISPLAPGHTLVIPKAHTERIEDLDAASSRALFDTVRRLAGSVRRSVSAHALTIGINDGREAGQVIPHVHVHIVPRIRGDGGGTLHTIMRRRPRLTATEMVNLAAKIAEDVIQREDVT